MEEGIQRINSDGKNKIKIEKKNPNVLSPTIVLTKIAQVLSSWTFIRVHEEN